VSNAASSQCAPYQGKDAQCSCRNGGVLLAASYCRRLDSSAAQCFSAKFIADSDSDRLPDSGFCSKSQPYSYRDSEGTDAHQSQPYSESNSNSDRHADTNAARLSQSEGLADANASTWIPLAALNVFFGAFGLSLLQNKTRQLSLTGSG
jgi:hypothetical protein